MVIEIELCIKSNQVDPIHVDIQPHQKKGFKKQVATTRAQVANNYEALD